MSNSSESDTNTHLSEGEGSSRLDRRRYKYKADFRSIKDLRPKKETKDPFAVQFLDIGTDVTVQDAAMTAPPSIESPVAENVPLKEKEEDQELENEEVTIEEQKYNTRALSKHSTTYELEAFEKNALIIFNQESVDGYGKRLGTERDVEALKSTFKRFRFEVTEDTERKDRTKAELFSELEEFSNTDFTDYGCIAVVILTHGSKNGMLRARDFHPYSELQLFNFFMNKPMLASKPILFIIQACRGPKLTPAMPVHSGGRVRLDRDEEVEPYTLPVEADMLILHSSYVGTPSHRNELDGSWFIQSLCKKIDEMADSHDFESILTEVKRDVAIHRHHTVYDKGVRDMVTNKQMPVTTSTLIRKLYLKKVGDVKEVRYRRTGTRQESRNEVLDSGTPQTPLGRCSCFLSHFEYIRECLSHFVTDHPDDTTALGFLNVANTFRGDREFDTSKEVMLRTICNHLMNHTQESPFYKYLYFYKH